jgi:hypothetical protein
MGGRGKVKVLGDLLVVIIVVHQGLIRRDLERGLTPWFLEYRDIASFILLICPFIQRGPAL